MSILLFREVVPTKAVYPYDGGYLDASSLLHKPWD